jgi:acetyltransferase-like isoleucine patch superfamily enzyme
MIIKINRLIPTRWRVAIRTILWRRHLDRVTPQMIWGYPDANGGWHGRTRLSESVVLHRPENIFIGNHVFIGHFCMLDGTDRLEIGEGCQLAGWNGIYTHSSHVAIRLYGDRYTDVPEHEKQGFKTGTVTLGNCVFVGAGAMIFAGVTIGEGALVAANTVVTRDVPAFAIVQGNPAQVVGDTRNMDRKHLSDPELREWYQRWQAIAS